MQLVWEFIRANVRMPEQVLGDIRAQISANDQGRRVVSEIMEEYDLTDLHGLAQTIHDASDRALSDALADVIEGTYHAEVVGDGYGEPFTIRLALTVKDRHLHFDFAGSAPQQCAPINSVIQYTRAYAAFAHQVRFCPRRPEQRGSAAPDNGRSTAGLHRERSGTRSGPVSARRRDGAARSRVQGIRPVRFGSYTGGQRHTAGNHHISRVQTRWNAVSDVRLH